MVLLQKLDSGHDKLPTFEQLVKREVLTSPFCPLCYNQVENLKHIIVNCMFAKEVWSVAFSETIIWEGDVKDRWFHIVHTMGVKELWLESCLSAFKKLEMRGFSAI